MLSRTAFHARVYRERRKSEGKRDVLLQLDDTVVAALDRLQQRRGLRNRSVLAEALIAKALVEAETELTT